MSNTRIALIGDYNASLTAHITISPALELAAKASNVDVEPVWIHTSYIEADHQRRDTIIAFLRRNMVRTRPSLCERRRCNLRYIAGPHRRNPILRHVCWLPARSNRVFQERDRYNQRSARRVESRSGTPLISKLSCSFVEVNGTVRLISGSLSQRLSGTDRVEEDYRCNYGLNPEFAPLLHGRNDIRIEGTDDSGEVRIIRLQNHPFFIATLFQPQRSALKGLVHPLIREFVSVSAYRSHGAFDAEQVAN